ncbi:MAG: right-handed parallel beta-helix repeat-containing protein [Anaerolineae bacterium]|nr:right-handed parallel beta-helix repeat-containing protein [Anaerolineae bacterium]
MMITKRIYWLTAIVILLSLTPSAVFSEIRATFTVNSTLDASDANIGNGSCSTSTGVCTLRAAIEEANFTTGTDTINFNIGSGLQTITPTIGGGSLPIINRPVIINGTTQNGYTGTPIIQINGGLTLTGGNSTVRGLIVRTIRLQTNGNNLIYNNFIGTNAAGNAAGGASLTDGILINNSDNNTIGGDSSGERNVISGHDFNGVTIQNDSTGNRIIGNYIGLNAAGTSAIPNEGSGVLITSGNNFVGGNTSERNVISGNVSHGVNLGSNPNNEVRNNYIGTNAAGTASIPNGGNGVNIASDSNDVISNVISGNGGLGIDLSDSESSVIDGNTIGLNAARNAALANNNGGISIRANVTSAQIVNNVISGNFRDGINNSGDNVVITANRIGTNSSGANLGNAGDGIEVTFNANNTTIGFHASASDATTNTIAFNGGDGIRISTSNNHQIFQNSLYQNGGLGINLTTAIIDQVTPNDNGDGDTGGNNLQNYPVITNVTFSGGSVTITGTLNSAPSTSYQIDFFSNSACDPSGHGEGEDYFGRVTTSTNSSGNGTFNATFSAPADRIITATARQGNHVSEFSACWQESILRNGGFEADVDPADGLADFWGIRNGTAEARVCSGSIARTGSCAFEFNGSGATEDSILQQRLDLSTVTLTTGDTLVFTGFGRASGSPNFRTRIVINYSDGSIQRAQSRFGTVTAAYVPLNDPVTGLPLSITLTRSDVVQVRVLFWSRNSSGRTYFDDLRLARNPSTRSPLSDSDLIPMPLGLETPTTPNDLIPMP